MWNRGPTHETEKAFQTPCFCIGNLNSSKRRLLLMPKCPICGRKVEKSVAEWNLSMTSFKQYECCGRRFRKYVRMDRNLEVT
jgi:hypothetical protein